jgi:MFS family permease
VGALVITAAGGLNVYGIRWVFALQLCVLGAELAVIVLKFRNPKARPTVATGGIVGRIREVMAKGVAVKRFLLYQSLGMVPLYLNAIYIPLYAAQVKRADTFTLGGMATASLLVPLILSVPSGRLADRFGRKIVVLSCLPLYCLSLAVLYFAPEAGMAPLILAGVFQGFYTLGIVTGNAIRAEIVPIGLLGSWSGLLGLFGGVVGIIVPVSAGLLWNALSPAYVIAILLVSQIAASAVLLTVPESLGLKREA